MLERIAWVMPQARIDGFTVQPMIRRHGARELILGMSVDPTFGPLMMFGAGGTAVEVLRVAQSEYEASIEEGKFAKPVEYQDSRGFVWQAERMIQGVAGELAKIDAEALARVRTDIAKLKAAWPAPMPPQTPVLEVGQTSAIISDIELHISRF